MKTPGANLTSQRTKKGTETSSGKKIKALFEDMIMDVTKRQLPIDESKAKLETQKLSPENRVTLT